MGKPNPGTKADRRLRANKGAGNGAKAIPNPKSDPPKDAKKK